MNRKKLMALLAAGIFSVVSINPTAVLAESAETESTTGEALAVPAGEAFVADGDGADGEMSVSDDGTPIKKTAKASEMGMASEDSYSFPFMGLPAVLPDELKKQIDDFRTRNFELQTSKDTNFDKIDQFTRENEAFRENPLVSDFLAAELAFCRMMQEIGLYVTDQMKFE